MEKKLTMTERLILSNQFEILSKLDPDGKSFYEEAQEILRSGFEGAYWELYQSFDPNPISSEICSEVKDIIEMFEQMEFAYDQASPKPNVEEREIRFCGFDNNMEQSHGAFTGYLQRNGSYTYVLKDRNLSAYMPMLSRYKRMLNCWISLGKPRGNFTSSQIEQIVAAGRN